MPVQLKKLRKCLKHYDVWEDSRRGKGSHTAFLRKVDSNGRIELFPLPVHGKDVLDSYVKALRRKLRLTEEDGVTDEDFFSKL